MNATDLYIVAKKIMQFEEQTKFQQAVNAFLLQIRSIQQKPQAQQPTQLRQAFNDIALNAETLISSALNFNTYDLTNEQKDILVKMDFKSILGDEGITRLRNFTKKAYQSEGSVATEIQAYVNDWNQFLTKATNLFNILNSLQVTITENLSPDKATVEITFSDKVDMVDFKSGKEQMEDWFFIIEGYAQLLDVRNEDFKIISISKESPTKIKIELFTTAAIAFLSVTSSILLVERAVIENRTLVEQLRQKSLISDTSIQNKFVELAENEMKTKLESEINKVVDEKLKEFNIDVKKDGKGDKKQMLRMSIEKQYNFMIDGGDVKIQIGNNDHQDEIRILEKSKEEIKLIKDSLINLKSLKQAQIHAEDQKEENPPQEE